MHSITSNDIELVTIQAVQSLGPSAVISAQSPSQRQRRPSTYYSNTSFHLLNRTKTILTELLVSTVTYLTRYRALLTTSPSSLSKHTDNKHPTKSVLSAQLNFSVPQTISCAATHTKPSAFMSTSYGVLQYFVCLFVARKTAPQSA